jgi:hypothetical protein
MPSLAALQDAFAAALTDPCLPPPSGLRRPAEGPRSRRFDVYRNNMAISLIEALEAAFPAVHRLVGDTFFKAAAKAYIRREPPRSPVLLLYGEGFGAFLDGFAPAASVPYLGDVARLEWARLYAYHAADAEPLSIARLAAVPQAALPETRLVLHPSLRLLRSRFPVASLWAATRGADSDVEVDMRRGEEVIVLRPALSVDARVLPEGGYAFIERLATGDPLGEAAGAAAGSCPGFDLAPHLQGLFQLGAVVAIAPPAPDSQQA